MKWIAFFQEKECTWSGLCDKEEIKSMYVYVATVDPGCLLFDLDLSLATGHQLNNSSMNRDIGLA